VGSNSVLLVVEERSDEGWRFVFESSEVSSLGEQTKETGLLGETGMRQTLDALQRAFAKSDALEAGTPLAAATMAARMARNTAEFLDRARLQNTPVIVLSGNDEATLGFLAVADDSLFSGNDLISIVDVGGQSTEIVTAERRQGEWQTEFRHSYPIGTLALLGNSLRDECPGPGAWVQACREVDEIIAETPPKTPAGDVVVLGATGTNLVSIRERLNRWDPLRVHGARLDYAEISKAAVQLASLPVDQRAKLPGIEPGRERTIPIGALILERCLFAVGAPSCRVSTRGWRYALLERGLPQGG
jgi:exopolyphosphatase/guanosine-5'-triphosphate,3'-diphosphate pyrophosphatase